jgi:hypothetical protein
VPDPKDTTITAYQSDIVSRLAGQTEISAGVKLTNRATATNRQAVRDYMKTLFQDLGLTPVEQAYGTGTIPSWSRRVPTTMRRASPRCLPWRATLRN